MTTMRLMATVSAGVLCLSMGMAQADGQTGGTLKILGAGDLDHYDPTSVGTVTANNSCAPPPGRSSATRPPPTRRPASRPRATSRQTCRNRPTTG